MTNMELGRIQARIMQILWEKKRATARELTAALYEYEPIDHRNVQLILRRLEKKGLISFSVDNRTHNYYPLISNNNVKLNAIKDFIDHMFQGSVSNMISALINHKQITVKEIKKLVEMLDKEEK